jgi:hypothetical protein
MHTFHLVLDCETALVWGTHIKQMSYSHLGQRFAMQELKIVIATLCRQFNFEALQTIEQTKHVITGILTPLNGLHVKVTKRTTK